MYLLLDGLKREIHVIRTADFISTKAYDILQDLTHESDCWTFICRTKYFVLYSWVHRRAAFLSSVK